MELIYDNLIQGASRILSFSIIPFIWWFRSARKSHNFLQWIGLKKIDRGENTKTAMWVLGIALISMVASFFIINLMQGSHMAVFEFWGRGINALPVILIYSIFTTSLPEEIFFRGFLLKRLSDRFGFAAGNIIQSILFGLARGIFFLPDAGTVKTVNTIVLISAIGGLMGYVNEQKAYGSILPSWCIHAVANIYAGICSAFLLYY